MEGKIKKINGIYPVTVKDAIYVGDGTSTKLQEYLDNYYKTYITPEEFGAKANGIVDCTLALQQAINKAGSTKGIVKLSEGVYKVTDRLFINNPVKIEGVNPTKTVIDGGGITFKAESNADSEYWIGSNSVFIIKSNYVKLTEFKIKANENINGITLTSYDESTEKYTQNFYSEYSFLQITNVNNGFFIYGGWDREFHNIRIDTCKNDGFHYQKLEDEYWTNSGDIIQSIYIANAAKGFYLEYTFETNLTNTICEYCTNAVHSKMSKNLRITNFWNEACYGKLLIEGSAYFAGGRGISSDTITHTYASGNEGKDQNLVLSLVGDIIEEVIHGTETLYKQTSEGIDVKSIKENGTSLSDKYAAKEHSHNFPTITDTYNADSSDGMSGKAVAEGIKKTAKDAEFVNDYIYVTPENNIVKLSAENYEKVYQNSVTFVDIEVDGVENMASVSDYTLSYDIFELITPSVNVYHYDTMLIDFRLNNYTIETKINAVELSIPKNLSQLSEDDTHKVVTSSNISQWNSAQANVIETIKVNNTALTPSNKAVNITVPTVTNTYSATSTSAMSGKAVASAIASIETSNLGLKIVGDYLCCEVEEEE